jgi:hypothetical protein
MHALTDNKVIATVSALTVSGSDIYIAGNEIDEFSKSVAVYWKNGDATVLTEIGNSGMANAIAIAGNNLYVVGRDTNINNVHSAVYWENGTKISLSRGANVTSAEANSIALARKK